MGGGTAPVHASCCYSKTVVPPFIPQPSCLLWPGCRSWNVTGVDYHDSRNIDNNLVRFDTKKVKLNKIWMEFVYRAAPWQGFGWNGFTRNFQFNIFSVGKKEILDESLLIHYFCVSCFLKVRNGKMKGGMFDSYRITIFTGLHDLYFSLKIFLKRVRLVFLQRKYYRNFRIMILRWFKTIIIFPLHE